VRLVIPGDETQPPSTADVTPSQETVPNDTAPVLRPDLTSEKPVVSDLAAIPKFQRIILAFIEKLEKQVVKMEKAWQQGDLAELAELAHWLKGAGGSVGYSDFTAPAGELEKFARSRQKEQTGRMLERVGCLAKAIVPPDMEQDRAAGKESAENNQRNADGNPIIV
jgi:HPt (histidine-containing phosphotransfer) domain-containing protein